MISAGTRAGAGFFVDSRFACLQTIASDYRAAAPHPPAYAGPSLSPPTQGEGRGGFSLARLRGEGWGEGQRVTSERGRDADEPIVWSAAADGVRGARHRQGDAPLGRGLRHRAVVHRRKIAAARL